LATVHRPLTEAQRRDFTTAVRLLEKNMASDALTIAERVAAAAPFEADVHHLVALCRLQIDAPDAAGKAESAFRRALELSPRNSAVLANLATLLRRLGRRDEAIAMWERAVLASPRSAQAWVDLGITALSIGNGEKALLALERATALQPLSVAAWHGLGNARRACDDDAGAATAFRRAVELDPNCQTGWVNLGVVLRLLGRPEESLVCYDRARRAGAQGPKLDDAILGALVDTGHVRDAIEQGRNLVASHPGYVPGHVSLGHLLWEYGSGPNSDTDPLEAFRSAADSQPRNLELQLALVRFLLGARLGHEALERIESLRGGGVDDARLKRLQADVLEMLGRSDEAGGLYASLFKGMAVADVSLLNAYTRHLLKSGDWKIAAQRATEAIALDACNQEALAHLGTAWRLLGDPREFWLCDYDAGVVMTEVEPPNGYANMRAFLAELTEKLNSLHKAKREPAQQSLRGGSQSPGRLFGRDDPTIRAAQGALTRAVEQWLSTLKEEPAHPFLQRNTQRVRFTGSWSVKLWSSGSHANHIHPQGWLSSAFYVALPDCMTSGPDANEAGALQLGQPPAELGLGLPPRRILRPKPGHLALFPSYMWHGTVPFSDAQPRLTIAFDMKPAG
jgi:tetratricopeptide (TPR) repeat protein